MVEEVELVPPEAFVTDFAVEGLDEPVSGGGCPGGMKILSVSLAHSARALLISSGPLSMRKALGMSRSHANTSSCSARSSPVVD